ncbi:MAG: NUDIX domain-containing protein [Candidatus Contendobacter sp.]|nr:NUDIX domain-containing protein [Candidatus Contendobacter sp.]MDG4557356.1 NUDIX domain-containing protein [Candidatus Contendobacter sp.]
MEPAYPQPLVMVDTALFTIRDERLRLILTRRKEPPFEGLFALPGGFVHAQEDADTEAAARRVIRGKIGFDAPYLEQLFTFSGAARDPRGWSVSVVYYALIPWSLLEGNSAAEAFPVDALPPLPFDHGQIVARAVERLRGKATYSSLPAFLLSAEFTMNELHRIYEQTIGARLDKASFRHKILGQDIIEEIPNRFRTGAHRPAQLYRLSSKVLTAFERKI